MHSTCKGQTLFKIMVDGGFVFGMIRYLLFFMWKNFIQKKKKNIYRTCGFLPHISILHKGQKTMISV